jgi:hypothetical protein
MNNEVERMLKEAVVVSFARSRHLSTGTEEDHENLSQDSQSPGRDLNPSAACLTIRQTWRSPRAFYLKWWFVDPRGSARLLFCFLPIKKHVKWDKKGTKVKYDIVYFKYFTKYVYLSRIHINSGTWLYFYLSLYVARPFTNGNLRIAGSSEIFASDPCLMLICKQVYTYLRGKGSSSV